MMNVQYTCLLGNICIYIYIIYMKHIKHIDFYKCNITQQDYGSDISA